MDVIGKLVDVKDAQTKAGITQTRLTIMEGNRKIIATAQAHKDEAKFAKTLIKGNYYRFGLGGDGNMLAGASWYFFNDAEPVQAVDPPEPAAAGHSITDTGSGEVDVDNPWPGKDRAIAMESAYSTAARLIAGTSHLIPDNGMTPAELLRVTAHMIYADIELARTGHDFTAEG